MSRSGDTRLDFGGRERVFRLALGEWRKVQERCDAGPAEILARLAPIFTARQQGLTFGQILANGHLGRWRVDDVREVIFQGLVGGGMDPNAAIKIVRAWVDERPLLESVDIAYEVVLASIIGPEDEQAAGESQAAAETSQASPAASSGSVTADTTPLAEG